MMWVEDEDYFDVDNIAYSIYVLYVWSRRNRGGPAKKSEVYQTKSTTCCGQRNFGQETADTAETH